MLSIILLLHITAMCTRGSAQTTVICPNPGYSLRAPGSEYCYRYYQIPEDFSAANRSCTRDGAILISIDDSSEDNYIYQTFFAPNGEEEFWIGLNDMETEGIFRWLNSSVGENPVYLNWSGNFPVDNSNARDCVEFAADGWRVHSGSCATSSLPHICKMRSCESMDGQMCIPSEAIPESSSVAIEVIIIAVVLVIIITIIIVVIVVLIVLWKFYNDAFHRFCCCCLSSGKSAVHSMQQENQRLRRELSQHKISLSGRYQPGQFERELSGVPDGKGGVLPTIKQPPPAGTRFSPTISESRMLGAISEAGDVPPPLVLQRPSQSSAFNRQNSQTSFLAQPPLSRPVRNSLPASFGTGIRGLPRPTVLAPVRGSSQAAKSEAKESVAAESQSESSESEEDTSTTKTDPPAKQ